MNKLTPDEEIYVRGLAGSGAYAHFSYIQRLFATLDAERAYAAEQIRIGKERYADAMEAARIAEDKTAELNSTLQEAVTVIKELNSVREEAARLYTPLYVRQEFLDGHDGRYARARAFLKKVKS